LAGILLVVFRLGLPAVFWATAAGHAATATAMLLLVYSADWQQAARDIVEVWLP
jgi:ABC-type spermidine/putrescine transport system permease subunit II